MKVSVIIAAYNAAATIAETLESLCAQTFPDWEAIVVDDASSDETGDVAARFAGRDDRVRLLPRLKRGGESAARNTGIGAARYDWLLFLDADDWIVPGYLERITGPLNTNPSLDVVRCGWTRVAGDGAVVGRMQPSSPSDEMFGVLARYCAFAIHSCVVRRSLVEAVGGFDPTLRTGPDWDLWQRIARAGARFGNVPELLAFYRMRAGSASADGFKLLPDGLRVIAQGHAPDPRVKNPHPLYADGMPTGQLPNARLLFMCWAAGLVLGMGEDARPLLDQVKGDHDPALNADQVARQILQAGLLPTCRAPSEWSSILPGLERNIDQFLAALEIQTKAAGLALRARRALERLVLEQSAAHMPLTIGTTHAVRIEITEPILDVFPPSISERLVCSIAIERERLGAIELPVCDGKVSSYVLADAIAAEFAWQILCRYFQQTIYQGLAIKPGRDGVSIWRGNVCLADGFDRSTESFWAEAHEKIGWTVFLQEIFSCPDWPLANFYESPAIEETYELREAAGDVCIVEVSRPIPGIRISGRELNLVPTVGGVPLGVVTLRVGRELVSAHKVRTALVAETGFELARAVVREGLLGRSLLTQPATLRERLAARCNDDHSIPAAIGNLPLVACSAAALRSVVRNGAGTVVFGRRARQAIGTSASRRAMFPAAAVPELIEAATGAGEIFVQSAQRHEPERVVYAPELIGLPTRDSRGLSPAALKFGKPFRENSARIVRKLWSLADSIGGRHNKLTGPLATDRLPILMYHSIAPAGPPEISRYRVSPATFEEQLGYLRDSGYYSVTPELWRVAMTKHQPLPGRAVILTFDDGYLDFMTHAWPLLKRYGFSALVFLVTEQVGETNRWDRGFGEAVALLGWQDIHCLRDEGIEFGSHSASHRRLDALAPAEIVREGARSRAILEQGLGRPVTSLAYPHGAEDRVVQHLIGACGYVFGFSCRPGLSGFHDPLLALPRIEVAGHDTLKEFALKMGGSQAPSPEYPFLRADLKSG